MAEKVGMASWEDAMNQKNLNYEIETERGWGAPPRDGVTMNQKNLNYEIETSRQSRCRVGVGVTMNQKNLNYEIETVSFPG